MIVEKIPVDKNSILDPVFLLNLRKIVKENGRTYAWVGKGLSGRAPVMDVRVWTPGDLIEDEYKLTIPADAQPGVYQISAGMYMWQTLERLPLMTLDGEVQPYNSLLIDGIEVLEPLIERTLIE